MQPTYARKLKKKQKKKFDHFQISENLEKVDAKFQRILTFPKQSKFKETI